MKRRLTLADLLLESVVAALMLAHVRLGRAHENRVLGMSLDVLLQILGPLEGFTAKVAFVWL